MGTCVCLCMHGRLRADAYAQQHYRKISNMSRTKSQNLNASRLIL